jgi:hypothetical protein
MYGVPFADVTALWSHHLAVVSGADEVIYRRLQWLPSSVNRALCAHCESPVFGRLSIPPVPPRGVTFCPANVWEGGDGVLPEAVGHIYYQSRVSDVEDARPKIVGAWRSQLAVTQWMLPRLLRP